MYIYIFEKQPPSAPIWETAAFGAFLGNRRHRCLFRKPPALAAFLLIKNKQFGRLRRPIQDSFGGGKKNKSYILGRLRRTKLSSYFRRTMSIPNMCLLVCKFDNGKLVSIANEQTHRITEPSSTVLVYRCFRLKICYIFNVEIKWNFIVLFYVTVFHEIYFDRFCGPLKYFGWQCGPLY